MCYKKFDENKNFLDAEQHCVDEGGHLARISTKDENEMVGAIGGSGVFWIGLWSGDKNKCYIDKSRFVWTGDTTDTDFDDWGSSQPDCCSPNNGFCFVLASTTGLLFCYNVNNMAVKLTTTGKATRGCMTFFRGFLNLHK